MEPILQNPQFTKLLRMWEFITTHYDYLELPQTFQSLSLYELNKHIECEKHMTECIQLIIEALVKKATAHQKEVKQHSTLLFLARNNKFNFFNDLLKTSSYELGLSQVNFSLIWRNLHEIDPSLQFHNLKTDDKYKYLIWLINLVSTSTEFKTEYLDRVKKQYGEACQQAGKDKAKLHQNYGAKLQSSIILGKDHENNIYFYISKIQDTIFAFNTKNDQWKILIGIQSIKNEVIEPLIKKPNLLTQHSLDLLENTHQLWKKLDLPLKHNAFNRSDKIFDIDKIANVENKVDKMKSKLHELDETYSMFIGDCYNFRWATKGKRIQFHEQINEAKSMTDLVGCLSSFFHQTKHSIQRKVNSLDSYNHSLASEDQPQDNFKGIFLRMNYLYAKETFAQNPTSKTFTVNIYHHIKNFLQLSQNFKPYFYEYLTLFVESMLGIIQSMYPGALQKRVKNIQKLKKQKQQRQQRQAEEAKRIASKNKLKKNNQQSSQAFSDEEEGSQTTAEKNQQAVLNGRRLRQKARVNYQINQSRSTTRPLSKQKPKPINLRNKKSQKGKYSKMVLDSDESETSLSLSQSDTEKQDKGITLDSYKYVGDEETQNFRRKLRNAKEKS